MLGMERNRTNQQAYQSACKNQVLACLSGALGISVCVRLSDWTVAQSIRIGFRLHHSAVNDSQRCTHTYCNNQSREIALLKVKLSNLVKH